jgi:hypothetical protein
MKNTLTNNHNYAPKHVQVSGPERGSQIRVFFSLFLIIKKKQQIICLLKINNPHLPVSNPRTLHYTHACCFFFVRKIKAGNRSSYICILRINNSCLPISNPWILYNILALNHWVIVNFLRFNFNIGRNYCEFFYRLAIFPGIIFYIQNQNNF